MSNLELMKERDGLIIRREELDQLARATLSELQVKFNEARDAFIEARAAYNTAKAEFGAQDRAIERQLLEAEHKLRS